MREPFRLSRSTNIVDQRTTHVMHKSHRTLYLSMNSKSAIAPISGTFAFTDFFR